MRPQIFRTHAMRMGIDLRGTFLEWRQLVEEISAASNRFRACCQLRHCERRVMIAAKDCLVDGRREHRTTGEAKTLGKKNREPLDVNDLLIETRLCGNGG
jgi:hypothetical protein